MTGLGSVRCIWGAPSAAGERGRGAQTSLRVVSRIRLQELPADALLELAKGRGVS